MKTRTEAQQKIIMHLHNNLPDLLKKPLIQDIKILQKSENARFEIRVGSEKKELTNWWKQAIFVLVTPTDKGYQLQIESKFERWPKDISAFAAGCQNQINKSTSQIGIAVKDVFGNDGGTVSDIRIEDKFVLKIVSNLTIDNEITDVKTLNAITQLLAKIAQIVFELSENIMVDGQASPDQEAQEVSPPIISRPDLDYVKSWNLDNDQVLVVAGDWAFNIAEKYGIYECQNKRSFRASRYMAFYKNSQIDTVFEIIDLPYDNGTAKNTPEMEKIKKDKPDYDDRTPRRIIKLKKLQSVGPILNDGKSKTGKTVPFTYGQPRYTTFDRIIKAKVTSELILGVTEVVILEEKGDCTIINPENACIKLGWSTNEDFDLAVLYKKKTNELGIVYFGNKGSLDSFPYMKLDKDERAGIRQKEEIIKIANLNNISKLAIIAWDFSNGGQRAAFDASDVAITIEDPEGFQSVAKLKVDEGSDSVCVASIENTGDGFVFTNESINFMRNKADYEKNWKVIFSED